MEKITNFRLGVGIPLTWTHIPIPFFTSFIQLEKPDFLFIIKTNGPLDSLRNNMVFEAKETCCTHLIMMDTDQTYPQFLIPQLLNHKKDIVGAVVHRRYPPFDPLLLKGGINRFHTADFKYGDLVEVDATGTGCLMFNMDVFYKTEPPWFKFDSGDKGGVIGEDIYFCRKIKEAGFKIFVDTALEVGHLSTLEVTRRTSELYKYSKLIEMEVEKYNEGKKWIT